LEELKEYLAELVVTFESQPKAFAGALADRGPAELHRPLSPGEWSPHQVMSHVLASEAEALLPRIRRLLEEDDPDLPNWDEAAWMADSYDPSLDIGDLLAAYAAARRPLADRLDNLPLAAWNRSGAHPVQGRRTVLWWLEYTVAHAKDHLNQLGA
jgi:hypothetical protein